MNRNTRFLLAVSVASAAGLAACNAIDGLTDVPGITGGGAEGGSDAKTHDSGKGHDGSSGGEAGHREGGHGDAGSDGQMGEEGGTDSTMPTDAPVDSHTVTDAPHEATPTDTGIDAPPPPAAPTLIAPLSTSHVTVRRPTLHWSLPAGVTDVTLDLCSDRACTKPIGTSQALTGSATSFVPTTDLPIGPVFWRLHPSTDRSVTSFTWEFFVGPVAAGTVADTSWGTTFDINGDGLPDVVAAGYDSVADQGSISVYIDGALSLNAPVNFDVPDNENPINEQFEISVASAGDVDGDGFPELIVGAQAVLSGRGAAVLFSGSKNGLVMPGSSPLLGSAGNVDFGYTAIGAGDINGDGYGDVAVGATQDGTGMAGIVYVYFGSASGLDTANPTVLQSPASAPGYYGSALASGDVNGDGLSDLVIGADGVTGYEGAAYIVLGSATGFPRTAPIKLSSNNVAGAFFGYSAAVADLNGDGIGDIIVGAPSFSNGATVYYYLGSTTLPATIPVGPTITGAAGSRLGFSLASAGDVNGDGFGDVVIGGPNLLGKSGQVLVYKGAAGGTLTLQQTLDDPPGQLDNFGESVAGGGLIDGYGSILVGAPALPAADGGTKAGTVYQYIGSSSGIPFSFASKLLGSNGPRGQFGTSVFGSSN